MSRNCPKKYIRLKYLLFLSMAKISKSAQKWRKAQNVENIGRKESRTPKKTTKQLLLRKRKKKHSKFFKIMTKIRFMLKNVPKKLHNATKFK